MRAEAKEGDQPEDFCNDSRDQGGSNKDRGTD